MTMPRTPFFKFTLEFSIVMLAVTNDLMEVNHLFLESFFST